MKKNNGFFLFAFDSAFVDAGLRTMFHAVTNVLSPVHSTPQGFENGALFLRLGLPSTLIGEYCPPKKELYFSGWAFRPH